MSLVFFSLSGLDLLGTLEDVLSPQDKASYIEWIYSQQVFGIDQHGTLLAGFRGGPYLGPSSSSKHSQTELSISFQNFGHLAMTYTALCSLLILGDDLSRVSRTPIIQGLKSLQTQDGSFFCNHVAEESDMRFLYCAFCISYILNDWSGININSALDYIRKSFNFDGGIGQGPGLESHGGSLFCAIASLQLLSRHLGRPLQQYLSDIESCRRWLLLRQRGGFNGRPNKAEDTCYAFWIGASLKLLDSADYVNTDQLNTFLSSTAHEKYGGFAKWPGYYPDILHSYFGVAALSIFQDHFCLTLPIDSALNISLRACDYLMAQKKI